MAQRGFLEGLAGGLTQSLQDLPRLRRESRLLDIAERKVTAEEKSQALGQEDFARIAAAMQGMQADSQTVGAYIEDEGERVAARAQAGEAFGRYSALATTEPGAARQAIAEGLPGWERASPSFKRLALKESAQGLRRFFGTAQELQDTEGIDPDRLAAIITDPGALSEAVGAASAASHEKARAPGAYAFQLKMRALGARIEQAQSQLQRLFNVPIQTEAAFNALAKQAQVLQGTINSLGQERERLSTPQFIQPVSGEEMLSQIVDPASGEFIQLGAAPRDVILRERGASAAAAARRAVAAARSRGRGGAGAVSQAREAGAPPGAGMAPTGVPGFRPPAGYRFKPDSTLERITGFEPGAEGRILPANIVAKQSEALTDIDTLGALGAQAKGLGLAGPGFGGEARLDVSRRFPGAPGAIPPEEVDFWQQYKTLEAKVRNRLFGASLTTNEQTSFERLSVNPNMDKSTIERNIAKQNEILSNAVRRQQETFQTAGYRTVGTAPLAAPPPPRPATTPGPQAPGATPYQTPEDVIEALRTGVIGTEAEAQQILMRDFGYSE